MKIHKSRKLISLWGAKFILILHGGVFYSGSFSEGSKFRLLHPLPPRHQPSISPVKIHYQARNVRLTLESKIRKLVSKWRLETFKCKVRKQGMGIQTRDLECRNPRLTSVHLSIRRLTSLTFLTWCSPVTSSSPRPSNQSHSCPQTRLNKENSTEWEIMHLKRL